MGQSQPVDSSLGQSHATATLLLSAILRILAKTCSLPFLHNFLVQLIPGLKKGSYSLRLAQATIGNVRLLQCNSSSICTYFYANATAYICMRFIVMMLLKNVPDDHRKTCLKSEGNGQCIIPLRLQMSAKYLCHNIFCNKVQQNYEPIYFFLIYFHQKTKCRSTDFM